MHIFSILSKNVKEPCFNISDGWTKNTIVWETFEKILKIFQETSKMHLKRILKMKIKPRINFSRIWTKTQIVRKFLKTFKIFLRKLRKIHYFSTFL